MVSQERRHIKVKEETLTCTSKLHVILKFCATSAHNNYYYSQVGLWTTYCVTPHLHAELESQERRHIKVKEKSLTCTS